MTGRKLGWALFVTVVLAIALLQAGGSNKARSQPRTDGWGDPFVTNAQVAAVKVGMSESAAFRMLGGQGSYGWYNDGRDAYEYPIRGTGDPGPDTMLNDNTTWFQICVQGNSVVSKARVPPSSYGGC